MNGQMKILAGLIVAVFSGCASMCDSRLDCDYHAYGGLRERQDRVNGRVDSIFDPAPSTLAATTESSVPELEPTPAPESETETGDGVVEDSGLADELIEGLEDSMQNLPNVPSDGNADFELDFNEI